MRKFARWWNIEHGMSERPVGRIAMKLMGRLTLADIYLSSLKIMAMGSLR